MTETLHTIAARERDRRAAGYLARLQDADPARRWSRAKVDADRAVWSALVDWLADRYSIGGFEGDPDLGSFAEATRKAARTALKAHVHDAGSFPKSGRAADLCRLARMIAIAAWTRGHPDAVDKYTTAMDLGQSGERLAA